MTRCKYRQCSRLYKTWAARLKHCFLVAKETNSTVSKLPVLPMASNSKLVLFTKDVLCLCKRSERVKIHCWSKHLGRTQWGFYSSHVRKLHHPSFDELRRQVHKEFEAFRPQFVAMGRRCCIVQFRTTAGCFRKGEKDCYLSSSFNEHLFFW